MTTAYNNRQKTKYLFYAVFICLILLVFDVVKLKYRYTAGEIIYNGYFGHTVIGTKNSKWMQNQWIKAIPKESKRLIIRAGTTDMINPSASEIDCGDGIFYVAESIDLPDGLTTIGDKVFMNTKHLKSIVIPNSVTSLGCCAFARCPDLKSITLSNKITEIPDSCFSGCGSLEKISLPKSVTEIGPNAFAACSNLTSVSIPKSVTKISAKAFDKCFNLREVSVPSKATIEKDAFPPGTIITRGYKAGQAYTPAVSRGAQTETNNVPRRTVIKIQKHK